MSNEENDVVIVGGGVAGLATALALHRLLNLLFSSFFIIMIAAEGFLQGKRTEKIVGLNALVGNERIGVKSRVLEHAAYLRTTGSAFLMWQNAWSAMEALGIAEKVRQQHYQLDGVKVLSKTSEIKGEFSLTEMELEARCVERKVLLETLADALPPETIRFNSKLVSLTQETEAETGAPFIKLQLSDGASMRSKVLIGCDGVYSTVSRLMGFGEAARTHRSAFRGMAVTTTMTTTHNDNKKKFGMIINGNGVRIGRVPCKPHHDFWFVTRKSLSSDDAIARDPEKIREAALETVKEYPQEIAELIRASPAETLNVGEMRMKWVWPWKWEDVYGGKGCVVSAGDALHSMWPDLAQGGCLALEDAVFLAKCLSSASSELNSNCRWNADGAAKVEECLKRFRDERKWRVCVMSATALMVGHIMSGWCSFLRFLRDSVLLPLGGASLVTRFAKFKCGDLPVMRGGPSEHPSVHSHLE